LAIIMVIFLFLISVVELKNSTFPCIAFFSLQVDMSNFIHVSFSTGFLKK
jgi:hypothetical protein